VTTQCKVEKWEADSGEVHDARTCVRPPTFIFSLLFLANQVAVALIFVFSSPILFRMPDDEKQRGALLIAACLIEAIRLRGEPIQPSPKLTATIYDSVQLAVLVWREFQSHGSLPKN